MKQFSDPHLPALLTMVVAVAASVWGARRHPGPWPWYIAGGFVLGLALLLLVDGLTKAFGGVPEPRSVPEPALR